MNNYLYKLHHPLVGELVKLFESEYLAMQYLICSKDKFPSYEKIKEEFKKFEEIGWKIVKYTYH